MKQFKAEWWEGKHSDHTLDRLITQHNALCDYLAEREVLAKLTPLPESDRVRVNDQSLPTLLEWNKQAIEQAEGHEIEAGKQTITIPKPKWWENANYTFLTQRRHDYRAALEAASKASGILYKLED